MLEKNMNLYDFWDATGIQNEHFRIPTGVEKHIKKSLEIRYRKNFSFDTKNISPNDANIGPKYNQTSVQQMHRIMSRYLSKNMSLWKCKPRKKHMNICVF